MADARRWEPQRRARRRALQALYQWQITGQAASEIVVQFHEAQDFSGVDADLFEKLVYGVVNDHEALESALAPVMHRPFENCEIIERVALMLGAWQLQHDPGTPFQVVLDEATDLAQRFGSENGYAYVNAVLNRLVEASGAGIKD